MAADRPNFTLADAVYHALAMPDVRAAAAYLAEQGAGFALICRVLKEPARRRPGATTEAPAERPPRACPPSA
jgi:hypothetical protein